jgi:regulatory helix-turn-helix LysR family protein
MRRISVDMFETFITLSRTKKMPETVTRLSITRQTVRRHIDNLEQAKGEKLIILKNHKYELTDAGLKFLPEVEDIIDQADSLLGGYHFKNDVIDGLNRTTYHDRRGHDFHSQQHPLNRLWIDSPPILQRSFLAWSNSQFKIEDPLMVPIKPFMMIYRKNSEGWICTHIGEKSSYATWFGWEWAKSGIGQLSSEDPTGREFDKFATKAYAQLSRHGGIRLDHVFAQIPRETGGEPEPVSFQKLLFSCVYPNKQLAIGLVVARTNRIEILGLEAKDIPKMSDDLLMEFDL